MMAIDDEWGESGGDCLDEQVLVLEGLTVGYGDVVALESVSCRMQRGRCLALVGPNGAGKSTLMKTVAGLLEPRDGRVVWRNKRLERGTSEIAYLAQREEVDWSFPITLRGLVEMGRYPHLGWWRRWRAKDDEVVSWALETMELTELASRHINALSGGQQQRAFIARALAQEARVLLLDEPFAGLDQPSQEQLTELLTALADRGHLVIASHHDLDTVRATFHEVLLLSRRLVAAGAVEEVFNEENLIRCYGRLNLLQEAGYGSVGSDSLKVNPPR